MLQPAGALKSHHERGADSGNVSGRKRSARPSLTRDREVWPEDRGVMVKRSDGERKRRGGEEMALGGLQKKQKERIEMRRKEKEDKRWRFNERNVTVGHEIILQLQALK